MGAEADSLQGNSRETFFASCPRGLESMLGEELESLGAEHLRIEGGGVEFAGCLSLCYRVNLDSRIASRVLWRVFKGGYQDVADIYEAARALLWYEWFSAGQTIKVNVAGRQSPLRSLAFATLRIKDAICDAFIARRSRRPSVETRTPDVQIMAFLDRNECTLYLDTSGEPLFKRGWRYATSATPLRENLAAGLLRLARWTPEEVLCDPLCGGGTVLSEAAGIAAARAPGRGRRFAFENFGFIDAAQWRTILEECRSRERGGTEAHIFGYDCDPRALEIAAANLRAAGLEKVVSLCCQDMLSLAAPAPNGVLVTNPPYGHRLGHHAALAKWYPKLGDKFKRDFFGWRAYILTADRRFPSLVGLVPKKKIPLFNGPLECRLYEFLLVHGSYRNMRKKPTRSLHFSSFIVCATPWAQHGGRVLTHGI